MRLCSLSLPNNNDEQMPGESACVRVRGNDQVKLAKGALRRTELVLGYVVEADLLEILNDVERVIVAVALERVELLEIRLERLHRCRMCVSRPPATNRLSQAITTRHDHGNEPR